MNTLRRGLLDRRKLHTRGSIKIQDYVICYLFSFPTLLAREYLVSIKAAKGC